MNNINAKYKMNYNSKVNHSNKVNYKYKVYYKHKIYYMSQDSSIGRTLISCINSENSNFSPG
jgi:hypothetical protein